jgi:hypothetical protein
VDEESREEMQEENIEGEGDNNAIWSTTLS